MNIAKCRKLNVRLFWFADAYLKSSKTFPTRDFGLLDVDYYKNIFRVDCSKESYLVSRDCDFLSFFALFPSAHSFNKDLPLNRPRIENHRALLAAEDSLSHVVMILVTIARE